MPAYFHRMVGAEMLKIITRVSGWAGLFLSALIPLLVTCMLVWMQPEAVDPNAAPDMNAAMMQSMIPDQAFTVLDWTLTGRNILIMPMVLLLITAQLFAGEWSERTLRSLLLRPVSRASVLMAKFSALWIYAGACLLVSKPRESRYTNQARPSPEMLASGRPPSQSCESCSACL